jgi:hypothetical protein
MIMPYILLVLHKFILKIKFIGIAFYDSYRGVASLFCSASNQTWKRGGIWWGLPPRIFLADLMQNGAF